MRRVAQITAGAIVSLLALLAFGQTHGQGSFVPKEIYDLNIKGERFRVPGGYVFPTAYPDFSPQPRGWPDPGKTYSGLMSFEFWLSDGKPSQHRMFYTPTFWPPEVSRPTSGSDDFIVWVWGAAYEPDRDLIQRQANARRLAEERASKGIMTVGIVHGLTCYAFANSEDPELCVTPLEHDPVVMISQHGGPDLRMQFYSQADKFYIDLYFPVVGRSRWQDVVCRTLSLIRAWRVSGGPAPPDCSKLPRIAFYQK